MLSNPNRKVIKLVKQISPKTFLVGFKLESRMYDNMALENTMELFDKSRCDLVIANSISYGKYNGYIIDANKNLIAHRKSKIGISNALNKVLKERI